MLHLNLVDLYSIVFANSMY